MIATLGAKTYYYTVFGFQFSVFGFRLKDHKLSASYEYDLLRQKPNLVLIRNDQEMVHPLQILLEEVAGDKLQAVMVSYLAGDLAVMRAETRSRLSESWSRVRRVDKLPAAHKPGLQWRSLAAGPCQATL